MSDETLFKVESIETIDGKRFPFNGTYATRKQITDEFIMIEVDENTPHEMIMNLVRALKEESNGLNFVITAGSFKISKLVCKEII